MVLVELILWSAGAFQKVHLCFVSPRGLCFNGKENDARSCPASVDAIPRERSIRTSTAAETAASSSSTSEEQTTWLERPPCVWEGGREGVALDIFEVPQPCTSRCLSRTMESYGRAGVSAPKTPSVDLSRMCVSCTSYTAITIAYLERGAGKPGASVGLASHRDSRSGCRPGVLLRFAARQGHDHPCGYGADSSHGGAERK